jgi:hypothetical protein
MAELEYCVDRTTRQSRASYLVRSDPNAPSFLNRTNLPVRVHCDRHPAAHGRLLLQGRVYYLRKR